MERQRHDRSILPTDDVGGVASDLLTFPDLPGHFRMYYQPEIDLHGDGRSISRCEALLRWHHPTFGVLRPGPALAGSRWDRQLRDLELWSMGAVCRQASDWDVGGRPVQIALNVTGHYLLAPEFLMSLIQVLTTTGVEPNLLAIDVPLSVFAVAGLDALRVAREVASLGVGINLDGVTGDTSCALLDLVTASTWKIELQTAGPCGDGLHRSVAAALSAARDAGASTVAKAVEDEVALRAVQAMGFDRAFGHAVSPAIPPEAMTELWERGFASRRSLFGAVAV